MDNPKDKHCGEIMDTWHNTIWCPDRKKLIRAQLYKCFECRAMHHREITWIPQYSDKIYEEAKRSVPVM